MNILEYIERVYQIWDGTDEHASICMRYINQEITNLNITNKQSLNFIKNGEQN